MTTITRTSHFVSLDSARRYYAAQAGDATEADQRLASGAIAIGEPPLKPGQILGLDVEEGRYFIEEPL